MTTEKRIETSFSIPQSVHKRLKQLARKSKRSMSMEIDYLVDIGEALLGLGPTIEDGIVWVIQKWRDGDG